MAPGKPLKHVTLATSSITWNQHQLQGKQAHMQHTVYGPAASAGVWLEAEEFDISATRSHWSGALNFTHSLTRERLDNLSSIQVHELVTSNESKQ